MAQSLESATGGAIAVNFAPSVTGGALPVSVTCSPASGSAFALGATAVTCIARDNGGRIDSCTFTVTVSVPPRLGATRFVAFGDSITEGALSPCAQSAAARTTVERLADVQLIRAAANPPTSYPSVLNELLVNRYTLQLPLVINEGAGGERLTDNDGLRPRAATMYRLVSVLDTEMPEVLLLQEGINDVNFPGQLATIPIITEALREMVRAAKSRGVRVFLGTLLPERPGSCRAYQPALVPLANDQIRAMAISEGVTLVDLYLVFIDHLDVLLGEDGLHPSVAGYDAVAHTFFDAIVRTLELSPFANLRSSR